MPLRGLFRSPLTRPRKVRRERSARRSSCAKKSAESRSCPVRAVVVTALSLVERLEVLLHLRLEVARHLLAGDGLLHHLAVLPEHPQVLQARWHVGTPPHHVGVEPILLARARFALGAHVVRIAAQALTRIALRVRALALARHHPLALRQITLLAGSALTGAVTPAPLPAAPVAFAAPLQALAVASLILELAHLRERALHGLHRAVCLPALQGVHPLRDVAAPVVAPALPPEPLHL